MARRRYVSTDISLDSRVNKLAIEYGDFAAMLYTWMIPHAQDDTTLPGNPEQVLYMVVPGRRDKTVEDITAALNGMVSLSLIIWDKEANQIRFPTSNFYKYQTYIQNNKRYVETAQNTTGDTYLEEITEEQRKTPQNTEENKLTAKVAENTASPSPSPSPSPSEKEESKEEESKPQFYDQGFKRVIEYFNQNIHPVTQTEAEGLNQWLDEIEADVVIMAIKESVLNGARTMKYINSVLMNWHSSGLKTKEAVEAHLRDWKERMQKKRDGPKKDNQRGPNQNGGNRERPNEADRIDTSKFLAKPREFRTGAI